MTMSIYTNQLTSSGSDKEITSADIVMLNGNNIVHSIDAEYNGINPIPSFDVVKSMSVDLSGKLSVIDKELSAHDAKLSSHMQYYGAFSIYETDITKLSTWLLSSFLDKNLNVDSTYVIDKGTMFKFLSSVSLSDSANVSIELFNNDYIVANTDIIVGQAMISSFDVIRDAQVEVDKFHDDLTAISNQLSTAISSKIFIDDRISGLSGCNDLSIIKLSADDYAALLSTGQVVSNCIYIVENPFKNMYGQQIKNLAPGTDLSDAVNLGQLLSVSNAIPISVSQLSNDAGYLTQHQSLSNYYEKTETSGSTQLETAFASKLDPSDVKISYVSAVRQIVLSSGETTTSVDCNDFIKDGMLSSAELCGTTLVLKFTTDAESAPISVELSNFVDDYDGRITALSDSISSISTDLSNYLDKRTGGYVSGDIGILSGNFIQTTTLSNVHNYSAANSFIQAESTKYGDPATGSKAYCILSVISNDIEKAIVISGDFGYTEVSSNRYPIQSSSKTIKEVSDKSTTLKKSLINTANPCLSDLLWSIALFNDFSSGFGHISAISLTSIGGISGTKLEFDTLPSLKLSTISSYTVNKYIEEFTDNGGDNSLYVRGFYEIGNQSSVPSFIGQHIEGGSSKAIGKYTHAEGRDTIADGRYSHAEGTQNIAGGLASHVEGQTTVAIGNASHAEGQLTIATGNIAHAEGYVTSALSEASHAEGYSTNATGKYSHAEGYMTYAKTTAGHSEGYQTSAIAGHSHAEGYKSIAEGTGSHAEGGYWWSSSQRFVGGYARGRGSHAEGFETSAIGDASHAAGIKSKALSSYQWVWNGNDNVSYDSKGIQGTFSINPVNGLCGFYIGENNLCSILSDYSTNDGTTVYLSSISSTNLSDILNDGQKLDTFNILKFDALSSYDIYISNHTLMSSDLILINEDNLDAENGRIINVQEPSNSSDAATKGYVDKNIGFLNDISSNSTLSDFCSKVSNNEFDISSIGYALCTLIGLLSKTS